MFPTALQLNVHDVLSTSCLHETPTPPSIFDMCTFLDFFFVSIPSGDVVLKDLQLKAEALNALKLPITVKAGFLGSVTLKVGTYILRTYILVPSKNVPFTF